MRILIDCSFVDFQRQPTGIPRVVLKYVEAGYAWGALNGVDVVPVVTTSKGVFPVRPVPGKSPPESLLKLVKPGRPAEIDGTAAAALLRDAESSLRAALIEAGQPSSVAGVEEGMSALFAKLTTGRDEAALEIVVGPGDIMFFPAYWHDIDPAVLEALKEQGAKLFVLVHDILPVTFAKFYRAPWRDHFADNLLAAINTADGMLAVSRGTADGVLDFARQNDARLEHVEVFHNGFDPLIEDPILKQKIDQGEYRPSFARKKKFDFFSQENPYLMVGTIEPKKGHVPVIQSFEKLWRDGFDQKLALAGRRGWMEEHVVRYIEGSEFFGDKLFWFDDLDDADLYIAYKYSRALIFGSYAEGFGIPMVEAAMSGLPLICYDTEVAREVAGDTAQFYSTFAELEQHIAAMEDDRKRAAKVAELDGFAWPSWQETGFRLFDHLQAAAVQ